MARIPGQKLHGEGRVSLFLLPRVEHPSLPLPANLHSLPHFLAKSSSLSPSLLNLFHAFPFNFLLWPCYPLLFFLSSFTDSLSFIQMSFPSSSFLHFLSHPSFVSFIPVSSPSLLHFNLFTSEPTFFFPFYFLVSSL